MLPHGSLLPANHFTINEKNRINTGIYQSRGLLLTTFAKADQISSTPFNFYGRVTAFDANRQFLIYEMKVINASDSIFADTVGLRLRLQTTQNNRRYLDSCFIHQKTLSARLTVGDRVESTLDHPVLFCFLTPIIEA